ILRNPGQLLFGAFHGAWRDCGPAGPGERGRRRRACRCRRCLGGNGHSILRPVLAVASSVPPCRAVRLPRPAADGRHGVDREGPPVEDSPGGGPRITARRSTRRSEVSRPLRGLRRGRRASDLPKRRYLPVLLEMVPGPPYVFLAAGLAFGGKSSLMRLCTSE